MNLGALYIGYKMNCLKCRQKQPTKMNKTETQSQMIITYRCKECGAIIFNDRYQKSGKVSS